jgi:hypothetical protein
VQKRPHPKARWRSNRLDRLTIDGTSKDTADVPPRGLGLLDRFGRCGFGAPRHICIEAPRRWNKVLGAKGAVRTPDTVGRQS